MRWKKREKIFFRSGDTRYKVRWLWYKKTIGSYTRWLEWAAWEEKYAGALVTSTNVYGGYWYPTRWTDI